MKLLLVTIAAAWVAVAAPKTWDRIGQLKPGAPIEVVTADRSEKGEFVASSSESVTIRTRTGEKRFDRPDVVRVTSRTQGKRVRNILIGAGIGVAIGLVTDQTLGTRLRNEGHDSAALNLGSPDRRRRGNRRGDSELSGCVSEITGNRSMLSRLGWIRECAQGVVTDHEAIRAATVWSGF